jgi:LysM repeat protein
MVARNPARYLAPVAIAATLVGGYFIVHDNLTAKHVVVHQHHAVDNRPRGKSKRTRYFTVQPGDNMTLISASTGVPLQTLESLNPAVNPNALQTGQRIRLQR